MNKNIDYEIPAYIRNLSPEQRADLENRLVGTYPLESAYWVTDEMYADAAALDADHIEHVEVYLRRQYWNSVPY